MLFTRNIPIKTISHKLCPRYIGPFTINQVLEGGKAFTVSRLLKYHHRGRFLQYAISWVLAMFMLDSSLIREFHRLQALSRMPYGDYRKGGFVTTRQALSPPWTTCLWIWLLPFHAPVRILPFTAMVIKLCTSVATLLSWFHLFRVLLNCNSMPEYCVSSKFNIIEFSCI